MTSSIVLKQLLFSIVISLTLSMAAMAQSKPQLHIFNLGADTSKLGGRYDIINGAGGSKARKSSLPSQASRDLAFEKAGLAKDIAQYDELAKDLLFLKAKSYDGARIQKSYPKLDAVKLRMLQTTLKAVQEK